MAVNTTLPTTFINVVYTSTRSYRDILRTGAASFGDIVIDAGNNTFHTHGHTFYFAGSDAINSYVTTDENKNASMNALFSNKLYINLDDDSDVETGDNGIYLWTKDKMGADSQSDGYPIITFNEQNGYVYMNLGADVNISLTKDEYGTNDIFIDNESLRDTLNDLKDNVSKALSGSGAGSQMWTEL